MKEITYKVNCPRDLGEVYNITIRLALKEDGSFLPSPCPGCNRMSGIAECTRCVDNLFLMSLKDPTMQSYSQPITP